MAKRKKTLERFVNGAVGEEQPALLAADKSWQKEWVGLPEFVQLRREPYAMVNVRFATAQDVSDFARLIGQHVQRTTKAIWFPDIVKGLHSKHEWVSSSDTEVSSASRVVVDASDNTDEHSDVHRSETTDTPADGGFKKRPKKLIAQGSLFRGENE